MNTRTKHHPQVFTQKKQTRNEDVDCTGQMKTTKLQALHKNGQPQQGQGTERHKRPKNNFKNFILGTENLT
jgi:hypothetical protein